MSTAGGGAATVIVDIMANASQLGQTLQQAERQVQESADKMGKAMDSAIGGGASGARTMADRIADGMRRHAPLVQNAAMAFGENLANQMNTGMDRRVDVYGTMDRAMEETIRHVPHWTAKLGTALGDRLKSYGADIGRELSQSILDNMYGMGREAEFEEGTYYGLGDYLSDVFQWRNPRSSIFELGRVRKIANQNLIQGRQDELAALQAEQQILQMTDQRGAMFQSRMHMGLAEIQTSMGTFRTGFGTPQEASARVYDAAIRQLVAMERIESIVKEIGHHARDAMRN